MRILIADNEVSRVLDSQMLTRVAAYGSVDIVQNGRDAVLAYVNSVARGAFYDLVVLDQDLSVQDGAATAAMIRMYESEHRKSGRRTMVCVFSSDTDFKQQHELRNINNDRTHILHKPVNLDILEALVSSVAAEINAKNHKPCSRVYEAATEHANMKNSNGWEQA